MRKIQIFSNTLGNEEVNAIKRVINSKWLGYGSESTLFEKEFSTFIKSKYALGINSATAGLFMSMDILGIGRGDEVILPSCTFVGCANAVVKAGAKPIFADVDVRTLNILPSEVERLMTKRTKAVMLLHYGGHPSDVGNIKKIIKSSGKKIFIIEDSANSIYSTYKGKHTGTLGDIGIFSFDAMKTLVTGDGGMMTFQNENVYKNAIRWRYLGADPDSSSGYKALTEGHKNWWLVNATVPGNRYIINDVTSAVGRIQLKKLKSFIETRKKHWDAYKEALSELEEIILPPEPIEESTASYYLFWLQMKSAEKRLNLAKFLLERGIYATFRYYPLHLIPLYKHRGKLANAEKAGEITLNIPIHQNLKKNDVEKIIDTIFKWSKKK